MSEGCPPGVKQDLGETPQGWSFSGDALFPLSARGRTNLELREKFILPEGASQGMTPFRSRGRRSKPSSRAASPTRSSSSASQSNHSCASVPSSPATPASGAKVRLILLCFPDAHPYSDPVPRRPGAEALGRRGFCGETQKIGECMLHWWTPEWQNLA